MLICQRKQLDTWNKPELFLLIKFMEDLVEIGVPRVKFMNKWVSSFNTSCNPNTLRDCGLQSNAQYKLYVPQ